MFIVDKQTLSDLNLWSSVPEGIFGYFDYAISRGGQGRLYAYFGGAFDKRHDIITRQKRIEALATKPIDYLFDKYVHYCPIKI